MRGRLALIVLPWVLAACSGGGADKSPASDTRVPPSLGERFYPPEGWGWGLVQTGDSPARRYGVAAAQTTAKADILILPDYGESAETWFETAHDLSNRGYRVWVLEADNGANAQAGAAVTRAMISTIIRPQPDSPLFILAQGTSAAVAMPAAIKNASVRGVVLSAPRLDGPPPAGGVWKSDGPDAFAAGVTHDRWRGAVTLAWQKANPDLRLDGPTPAWTAAYRQAIAPARRDLAAMTAPVLVIEGDQAHGCYAAPKCAATAIPGGGTALELERDSIRDVWLGKIDGFIATALAAKPATKARDSNR